MTTWPQRKLSELLCVQNGYAFDSKRFSNKAGMPLIRIRDIKNGTNTEVNYTGPFGKEYIVKAGDFLIGMDGEFNCHEWQGEPALLNQRVCRLQDFSASILPRFLFHGINSFLKEIEGRTGYTTVKHLSSKTILNIEFPLPPLPEQKRIVAILDEAFSGIARSKEIAEKNLSNANSLFDSTLFNTFVYGGEGWHVKKISEIANHSLGKMLDKAKNKGTPQKYLRNLNVRWFKFDLSDLLQMPFQTEEFDKYTVKKGDVLICEGGYPGRAAIWNEDYPIYFQKALHRVRFHEHLHNKWFVYYLYSQDKCGKLKQHFNGTGIQHFTGEVLHGYPIPIPPTKELKRIIDVFDKLFIEKERLAIVYQKKLNSIEELNKAVLHKAFAGEF